jgi:hypothetical protein
MRLGLLRYILALRGWASYNTVSIIDVNRPRAREVAARGHSKMGGFWGGRRWTNGMIFGSG